MKQESVLSQLEEIVQVDIDAAHAYDRAINQIQDDIIRERLANFRDEHRKHIIRLVQEITSRGGSPLDPTPDVKGYLMQVFTALRSVSGTRGALAAMKLNEELTHAKYAEVFPQDFPEDVKEVLRSNLSDEKRHLDYIANNLKSLS